MHTHCSCIISCRSCCEKARCKDLHPVAQCAWITPSYTKSIDYVPIRIIKFTSASGKKRKIDEMLDESTNDNETVALNIVHHQLNKN